MSEPKHDPEPCRDCGAVTPFRDCTICSKCGDLVCDPCAKKTGEIDDDGAWWCCEVTP